AAGCSTSWGPTTLRCSSASESGSRPGCARSCLPSITRRTDQSWRDGRRIDRQLDAAMGHIGVGDRQVANVAERLLIAMEEVPALHIADQQMRERRQGIDMRALIAMR